MKKLIIPLMLLASSSASAIDLCVQMSELSETIMGARQKGVDIIQMLTVVDKMESVDPAFFKGLIVTAYETPLYHSVGGKNSAIQEFKTTVFIECYKRLGDAE